MQSYEDYLKPPNNLRLFNILTLTHLVLGVLLVDNEQATLATHDFAVRSTLLQ